MSLWWSVVTIIWWRKSESRRFKGENHCSRRIVTVPTILHTWHLPSATYNCRMQFTVWACVYCVIKSMRMRLEYNKRMSEECPPSKRWSELGTAKWWMKTRRNPQPDVAFRGERKRESTFGERGTKYVDEAARWRIVVRATVVCQCERHFHSVYSANFSAVYVNVTST